MNRETKTFIQKMAQARRLQMEAIESILPEEMKGHLKVIKKETKMMTEEVFISIIKKGMDLYQAYHEEECMYEEKKDPASEEEKEPRDEKRINRVTIE